MDKRDGMFYWRGDFRPGFVCTNCNALFPVAGEEIEPLKLSDAASNTSQPKE